MRIEFAAAVLPPQRSRRALGRFCRAAAAAAGIGDNWRLGLTLVDDEAMRRLNRDWRGKDRSTNVLSFPGAGVPLTPRSRLPDLGEIVLSPTWCAREADEVGMDRELRLGHLVVHGLLHLAGWDHERSPDEAAAMEALEARILAAVPAATFRDLRPLVVGR